MAWKLCTFHFSYLRAIFIAFLFIINRVLCNDAEGGGYMRKEHSLIKPYQGLGFDIPFWDILGSTMVTNQYVRLTPDRQSKQGAVWNTVPIYSRNWEVVVQFKVHGQGTSLFGDGFVIWYTKDRMKLGPVFGNMDHFTGLAIFFDTYSNQNDEHAHMHPYISSMINNGTLGYDHDRDGTHSQVAGCSAAFRGRDYDTHALIQYFGDQNRLRVLIDIDDTSEWKECFDVGGIHLPTGYYLGASAATGDLADNHDIIAMRFYEMPNELVEKEGEAKKEDKIEDYSKILPAAESAEPIREHVEGTKGSFSPRTQKAFTWIFWIFVVLFICGAVMLYLYKKKEEESRKRFF